MNEKNILRALGNVDNQYVKEAEPMKKQGKKITWQKWAAMTACLCLVVAGALTIPNWQNESPHGQGTMDRVYTLPQAETMSVKLVEWSVDRFKGIVVDVGDNSIFPTNAELSVVFDYDTEILLDNGTVIVFNPDEPDTDIIGWKEGTVVTVKFANYHEYREGNHFYNHVYASYVENAGYVEYSGAENENNTSAYVPDGMDIADENDIGNSANTQKFNRSPEKVDIRIDNETIKPTNVSIIITDNNENHYGWGVAFRVQKKIDGEWKDLDYVIDDVSWIEIAYEVNEENQLTQNLDIDKYYGKLSSGTYRIVKPVYDNGYVDIYSNEFEIK